MSDENMTNPEVEVTPVVETPAEVTQEEVLNVPAAPVEEGKPVGEATIVDMETPAEVFPTTGETV